ncbi:MAG: hypothetical protein ACFFBH_11445 [Promethearchaeota archaeon]
MSKEKLSQKNKELDSYIKTNIIKNSKRLKGRFPPILETIEGVNQILKVKAIYELSEELKDTYLIKVQNYQNKPKVRYFLVITLASQSSDFLVILAKNHIKEFKGIKLIQFSIYPKNFRISLLALNEVKIQDEFMSSLKHLKNLRMNFRKKLHNLKNLIENH